MDNLIKETRYYNPSEFNLQFRALEQDGKKVVEAYAAVFNQRSKLLFDNLGGRDQLFYEELMPTCFDSVMRSPDMNVILTFNHNPEKMLGRCTKSNGQMIQSSIELSTDEYGLKYRTELPDTQLGRDVWEQIKRGDLFEGSFVFSLDENQDSKVSRDSKGNLVRQIVNIRQLFDVSIVISGAYANTDISTNSRQIVDFIQQEEKIEEITSSPELIEDDEYKTSLRLNKLRLLKIK